MTAEDMDTIRAIRSGAQGQLAASELGCTNRYKDEH